MKNYIYSKIKAQNKIGNMKNLMMLTFILTLAFSANAQEYKVKFSGSSNRKLVLGLFNSDVKIEAYNGDEIIIQASGYKAPPKRADGLKPLSSEGVDNSGIGLAVTDDNNKINITKVSRGEEKYLLKVPKKIDVVFEETNWMGGKEINVSGIEGEVEVSTKTSNIVINNVSGPVVSNSTSGDITVVYAAVSSSKPSSISNISGFIDVTLPTGAKATLKLKTISGEIYSNVDISTGVKKQGMNHIGGNIIEGTLNGGGAEINISGISGDVFIRKGK